MAQSSRLGCLHSLKDHIDASDIQGGKIDDLPYLKEKGIKPEEVSEELTKVK